VPERSSVGGIGFTKGALAGRAEGRCVRKLPFIAAVGLAFVVAVQPAWADLASNFGVYAYPTNGQSPAQQNSDEAACYDSAQSRTGYTPGAPQYAAPASPPPKRHGFLRGAAGGAAGGAAIGAIAGNAGEGAAIGAIAGGLFGRRRERQEEQQSQQQAQSQAQAQTQQRLTSFQTAFSACMTARGYVAK